MNDDQMIRKAMDTMHDAVEALLFESVNPNIVANAMLNTLVVIVAHSVASLDDLDGMTKNLGPLLRDEVRHHIANCDLCDPSLKARLDPKVEFEVAELEAMYNLPPKGSC